MSKKLYTQPVTPLTSGSSYSAPGYPKLLPYVAGYLPPGENVYVTEKLGGENMRVTWDGATLHVGSRNNWRVESAGDPFWKAVTQRVRDIAQLYVGSIFYGEKYNGEFYLFDILNPDGKWANINLMRTVGMQRIVPELYRGPFLSDIVLRLGTGASRIDATKQREGCVVQSLEEREDPKVGRLKFKIVGEV